MAERAKTQHFVPRFLLRRFCEQVRRKKRTKNRIFVHNLADGRVFRTGLGNVAASNRFYDLPVNSEVVLTIDPSLQELESLAAPAIAKLVQGRDLDVLTTDDRAAIAFFVTVQAIRGPATRTDMVALPQQLAERLSRLGPLSDTVRRQLKLDDPNASARSHIRIIQDTSKVYPVLVDRVWRLHVPPKGRRFALSDNPVLRYNDLDLTFYGNLGFLSKGVVLELALSPTLSLAIIEPSAYNVREGEIVRFTESNLLYYNYILAHRAERQLYAKRGSDFDVRDGMWQEGPRMKIDGLDFPEPTLEDVEQGDEQQGAT